MNDNFYMSITNKVAILTHIEDLLQRFAARFGTRKSTGHDLSVVTSGLMQEGYFFDEFVYLDDDNINFEEKSPHIECFLSKLGWSALNEQHEFLFLTGLYAQIGKQNDIKAYYAICEWMHDVGEWLDNRYSKKFVGDLIGANKIYGSFYSPCKYTGYDLIPSVIDPRQTDWDQLGDYRPAIVFAKWLEDNPDHKKHQPIELSLLPNFKVP